MRTHHTCPDCGGHVNCEALYISTMGYGWKNMEGIIPGVNPYWSCPLCLITGTTMRMWLRAHSEEPNPRLLAAAVEFLKGMGKLVRCMECMEASPLAMRSILPFMRLTIFARYFGAIVRKSPGVLPTEVITLPAQGLGETLQITLTNQNFRMLTHPVALPGLRAVAMRGWPALYTDFLATQDFPFSRESWETFSLEAARWEQRHPEGQQPLQTAKITLPKGAVRCWCNNCRRLQVEGDRADPTRGGGDAALAAVEETFNTPQRPPAPTTTVNTWRTMQAMQNIQWTETLTGFAEGRQTIRGNR